jgi:3-dehydroquinate dehydratase type I
MICLSIADVTADEAVNILGRVELAELRLDRIDFHKKDLGRLFSTKAGTIVTCRRSSKMNEDERRETIIEAIEKGASMVDVEVENSDDFKNEITNASKKNKCTLIVSYHDYEKTPVMRELEQILTWCFESGADIAKIACQANSPEEAARLLALYSFGRPLISIGMGEAGKITRIAAPLLGAPFTYASGDDAKKTAPGQIEAEKIKTIIKMIKEA